MKDKTSVALLVALRDRDRRLEEVTKGLELYQQEISEMEARARIAMERERVVGTCREDEAESEF